VNTIIDALFWLSIAVLFYMAIAAVLTVSAILRRRDRYYAAQYNAHREQKSRVAARLDRS
jgi:hypothetical protein